MTHEQAWKLTVATVDAYGAESPLIWQAFRNEVDRLFIVRASGRSTSQKPTLAKAVIDVATLLEQRTTAAVFDLIMQTIHCVESRWADAHERTHVDDFADLVDVATRALHRALTAGETKHLPGTWLSRSVATELAHAEAHRRAIEHPEPGDTEAHFEHMICRDIMALALKERG